MVNTTVISKYEKYKNYGLISKKFDAEDKADKITFLIENKKAAENVFLLIFL